MLRTLWLFAAVFALAALSSAFSIDDLHLDGIEAYLHHGEKRQASGTGNTPPPASSTPRPPPSSNRPPVSTPTPTPNQPPSSDPPKSTSQPQPAQSSSANNQPTSDAPPTSSRATTPRTSASPLVSTSFEAFVTILTTTSDGQPVVVTSTGTKPVPITTGEVIFTDPATAQPNSDHNNGGLSQAKKNIIGGVVGGVGGLLLLGGIALVFLRMKRRQTRVHEDDDDMTLGTGSALGDKQHSGHGPTPFQSNLEQYHNPGGRPNAAANF